MGVLARVKKSRQSAAFRRRPKGYGGHCEVAGGHTNGRPSGPLSVLVDGAERACGEPVEDRRSRAERDTTEAASRLTRRECDAGAAVLGGRGQGNEHAASRRSAWGAGAELGF